jgi:hypothetical protein
MVFVDQPVNTGFSFSTDDRDRCEAVAGDRLAGCRQGADSCPARCACVATARGWPFRLRGCWCQRRCYDEECVSNDMLDFLVEFFKARPELEGRDLYVTGAAAVVRPGPRCSTGVAAPAGAAGTPDGRALRVSVVLQARATPDTTCPQCPRGSSRQTRTKS